MGSLTSIIRCGLKLGFSCLVFVGTLTLGTTAGFCSSPDSETIQAAYSEAGNMISVTLVIYKYSTASDIQILSQAFVEGQDQGLAGALSKTKAVGLCSITGVHSFDVAFIQAAATPTGRQITFITIRPIEFDDVEPGTGSKSFDLAVGQFDLNDSDKTKNTGFLYPASKLVVDKQGEFHYDLAGSPWSLIDVLDSRGAAALAEHRAPAAISSTAR